MVVAQVAVDNVRSRAAIEVVRAKPSGYYIVAALGEDSVIAVIAFNDVVALMCAIDFVVAFIAKDRVAKSLSGEEPIVAWSAADVIGGVPGVDFVVTSAAINVVRPSQPEDLIVAEAAKHLVAKINYIEKIRVNRCAFA